MCPIQKKCSKLLTEKTCSKALSAVSWPAHEGNIDRSVVQTQNKNYFFFNGKIVLKMLPTEDAGGWCPITRRLPSFL